MIAHRSPLLSDAISPAPIATCPQRVDRSVAIQNRLLPRRLRTPSWMRGLATLACVVCSLSQSSARADLVLDALGSEKLIDFQDYEGAGLEPGGGGGTLDSNNWTLQLFSDSGSDATGSGDSVGTGLFGRGLSSGGVSETGIYAFETGGGNRALGFQIGPDGFAGAVASLGVRNETGALVDQLRVRYDIWVYNDSDNTSYFDLEFSDGSDFFDPLLFDTEELADNPPGWVRYEMEYNLTLPAPGSFGGSIAPLNPGDGLFVEWSIGGNFSDLNGYDEVALDNVRITAFATAVPEPSTFAWLGCVIIGGVLYRRRRPR